MILDFLQRLTIGFSAATSVHWLDACESYDNGALDERYAGVPKSDKFPNPWHLGVLNNLDLPNPEEKIQSELELLAHMFTMVVQLKPMLVVETGCHIGLMARALGAGCWTNGFGKVVASDIDSRMVECAQQLCARFPVEIRHCPALALPELSEADLVFIDSSYESRSQEITKVKPGAVYVYHDSYVEPHIKLDMRNEEFRVHLDSPRGFSIVRKPQP